MTSTPTTDTSFFLPDFCAVRMVFAVVIISELLAILITLAPMDSRSHFWSDLSIISLFVQWVGLSSAGLLCVLRPWLSRQSEKMAASLSYLLLLLTTLLLTEVAYWIGQQTSFSGIDLSQWRLDGWHGYLLLHNLGISTIVSALVLRYFYVQHQWQQNMRAEALARVQALQSRIRPHFLFNSLNTIASLTQIDPNQAEVAVEDLADLFRNSLADAGHQVSLQDELRLSQRYLDIEALRLGQRLKLRWCVDELPMDAQVPRLLIQPLLENAIYHGIEPLAEGGTIGIDGHLYGDEIYITISNPLPDKQSETERKGNRIAQENVRQRLAALYGEDGKLTVQADHNDYLTTISLPYIKQGTGSEEKKT
jgi:two-component system sensor histidine kinase AlgZ